MIFIIFISLVLAYYFFRLMENKRNTTRKEWQEKRQEQFERLLDSLREKRTETITDKNEEII